MGENRALESLIKEGILTEGVVRERMSEGYRFRLFIHAESGETMRNYEKILGDKKYDWCIEIHEKGKAYFVKDDTSK